MFLFGKGINLELELILNLEGICLGLVEELILIVSRIGNLLFFQSQGRFEISDFLLGLFEFVTENSGFVLCRTRFVGCVDKLTSKLSRLSTSFI